MVSSARRVRGRLRGPPAGGADSARPTQAELSDLLDGVVARSTIANVETGHSAPSYRLLRAILVKLFVERQIVIDTSVVEFLVARIERSVDAARRVVELLDREALERGRRITRPLAADVLKRLEESGGGA